MSDKNTVWYSRDNYSETHALETIWNIEEDGDYIAQDAAEDFHENHDGWESSWPMTINIHSEKDGEPVKSFKVEREYEPIFSASAV